MGLATTKMGSYVWSSRAAGALLILGTATGVLSAGLVSGIMGAPDYLVQMAANENVIVIGAFFELVMAFACAGIAIALYPVLRRYSEGLALGAVGFRLIEGVLMITVVISFILLLAIGQEVVKAGPSDSAYLQSLGTVVLAGQNWIVNAGLLLPWCIGALLYYLIFYQAKLVPRWLTAWGIAGIILALVSCMLYLFQVIGPGSTVQTVLNLPIALQELVLAVWLIVKGFNPAAIASLPAMPEPLIRSRI